MKFVRQSLTIRVTNCDKKLRMMMGDSAQERKHGEMLPSTIRAVICGPSNCGKTNVLISLIESPHGVRFENVYLFSKSLQQPKYQYLENLLTSIDEIGYFTFNNSDMFRRARRVRIQSSSSTTLRAINKMLWENTFQWAATRTSIVFISVRRTREYLNIWYAITWTF